MSTTIAVSLMKGGVGKTTCTLNMAVMFASEGYKVLVIDLDAQRNSGVGLTDFSDDKFDTMPGLYELLLNPDSKVNDYIIKTKYKNIFMLPSSSACYNISEQLKQDEYTASYDYLNLKITPIKSNYDIILIDCPPNSGTLTVNAYRISDYILMPITCSKGGVDGFKNTIKTLNSSKRINPEIKLLGAFLNFYNGRSNVARYVESEFETSGYQLMNTKIRSGTKADESTFEEPVVLSHPKSNVGQDFIALYQEIKERLYNEN